MPFSKGKSYFNYDNRSHIVLCATHVTVFLTHPLLCRVDECRFTVVST